MSKSAILKWFNIIIVCFFMFGFRFVVHPFSTVTEVGVNILGVFIGLIYGWSFVGMLWPSLLGMVAVACSGLMDINQVVAQSVGNYTILFLILIMMITENMNQTGFTNQFAYWLINRKFCKGHPWVLIITIFMTTYLVSAFSNAFVAIFLCWSLWYSICKEMGYKPFDKFTTVVITGTILSCVLGSLILPFHQLPMVILNAFGSNMHETANYGAYMGTIIPYTLVCLLEYILICKFFVRPDMTRLQNFDVTSVLKVEHLHFTKRQIGSALGLLCLIIMLMLPGFVSNDIFIIGFLSKIGIAGAALIVTVVMVWLKVEGKPLLDFEKSMKDGVNWNVIFFFTMVLFISSCLSNEATGIFPWIVSLVQPIIISQGAFGFVVLLLAAATIITNFCNNTVVCMTFMQLVIAFSEILRSQGIESWAVVSLLLVAANLAFWTPVASSTAGLLYGNTEWIKKFDVFKIIFPTSVIWWVSLLVIAYPLSVVFF